MIVFQSFFRFNATLPGKQNISVTRKFPTFSLTTYNAVIFYFVDFLVVIYYLLEHNKTYVFKIKCRFSTINQLKIDAISIPMMKFL